MESAPVESAKVVARFTDGRILKGWTHDFSPDASVFHLNPLPLTARRGTLEVPVRDLKALFFVRDFAGNPDYRERKHFRHHDPCHGRKVKVVFDDGESIVGSTMSYDPRRSGFFVFPVDPRSNNLRLFAVSDAVRQILPPGDPGDNHARIGQESTALPRVDPKLVQQVQGVVGLLRQTMAEWEMLVRAVEALNAEHARLRARCAELEREQQELRALHQRLREERDDAVRMATRLQATPLQEAVDTATRSLRELRERHERTERERQSAADELSRILRRFRG